MTLAILLLYAVIAVVTYGTIAGPLRRPWRLTASALWPLTLVGAVAAGVLVLPLAVLALIGHAISWYRRARSWTPHTLVLALLTAALSSCTDPTESPNFPAAERADASPSAVALELSQVSAGSLHNCAIAADNRAYCWGGNVFGQLGNGKTAFEELAPQPVVGGLRFRQISAGSYHTCGITMNDRIYCWGLQDFGNGTSRQSTKPVAVPGGAGFRQVSAGREHTCGVTSDGRAFCWGLNHFGQLGQGTSSDSPALSPVAVVGGLRFRGVSVGAYHSCGVTMNDVAYCWGGDQWGQLGDGAAAGACALPVGPLPCRTRPTRVAGGLRWRQLDAGGGGGPGEGDTEPIDGGRTCGITTDDRAFCWGDGTLGQNGDGTTAIRKAPKAVAGGLPFRAVAAGHRHTCGLTTDSRAYCWGWNTHGQIGDGTEGTIRLQPRRVLGNHRFEQITAGLSSTCARTPAGVGYCWGGAVGNGTDDNYLMPKLVGGT